MRRVGVWLLLTGCNQVWGIKETVDMNAVPPGFCDPLPYDPLRYRSLETAAGTWSAARSSCHGYGMDLAVIDADDRDEIVNELGAATMPFWLGVSFDGADWSSIDKCSPLLKWSSGDPTDPMIGDCAVQTSGGLINFSCAQTMIGASVINALCETPRPDPRCRDMMAERDYIVIDGSWTGYDAQAMCAAMGRHVVEINSNAELHDLLGTIAQNLPRFWVAARRVGSDFSSPTGCPEVYAWAGGEPSSLECVRYDGAMVMAYCSDYGGVICELNSQ